MTCANPWYKAGLETIRARHSCAHRVVELMAILTQLGAGGAEAAA